MLPFNELHPFNKTTEDTFASISTLYSFYDTISLYYFLILILTNVQLQRISVHLPTKTRRVAISKRKSLVILNKSCTITFCRRGYGLKENTRTRIFAE